MLRAENTIGSDKHIRLNTHTLEAPNLRDKFALFYFAFTIWLHIYVVATLLVFST